MQSYFITGSTPGVFDHVINNDVLEDSYERLRKIFINVSTCYQFIVHCYADHALQDVKSSVAEDK